MMCIIVMSDCLISGTHFIMWKLPLSIRPAVSYRCLSFKKIFEYILFYLFICFTCLTSMFASFAPPIAIVIFMMHKRLMLGNEFE